MIRPFQDSSPSSEDVREVLDEIFQDPEFSQETGLWGEVLEWIGSVLDSISDLFGGEFAAAGGFMPVLLKGLLILVGAAILILVTLHYSRAFKNRRLEVEVQPDAAQVLRDRVSELRARAHRARLEGDFLLAVRLNFFALVVGLGERGELSYNDAWTNRELFERGRPDAEVAATLRPLLGELDSMSFGERVVQEEDVSRFSSFCDRWLGRGDA